MWMKAVGNLSVPNGKRSELHSMLLLVVHIDFIIIICTKAIDWK